VSAGATHSVHQDQVRAYQELARAILQSAVKDVQCPREIPAMRCVMVRHRSSCPMCRELALLFLDSEWARDLAQMVGIGAERWYECVRELEHQALANNRRPSDRVAREVAAYMAEHPSDGWQEIFLQVEHHYGSPSSLGRAMRSYGLRVSDVEATLRLFEG